MHYQLNRIKFLALELKGRSIFKMSVMIKRGKLKKGSAHIEVILSFVIFISFLVFLLIMFRPLKLFSSSSSILDVTKTKILDYVSTDLSVISLYLNISSSLGKCIVLKEDLELPGKNIIVKDEDGNIIRGDTEGGSGKVRLNYTGKSFYRVYSSEELKERGVSPTGGCGNIDKILSGEPGGRPGGSMPGRGGPGGGGGGGGSGDYAIGLATTSKKVALSKLNAFFNNYTQNYQVFKSSLGLTSNFNVRILNNSKQVINNFTAEIYKPSSIEIMAKDILIEILDENATITPAIMNLQVWE